MSLLCITALCLALTLAVPPARGDGGHIALHKTVGRYDVTLFSAPEPLVAGPIDLSLLVQDAATGEILGDATAVGTLTSGSRVVTFSMSHRAASNKLLLAATPSLPGPGSYTAAIEIGQPGTPALSVTVLLPVAADHRRRTTLLFAVLLPLAAILLFLLNQHAKRLRRAPALH